MDMRLENIREQERKSHMEVYSSKELYTDGSWLRKPVQTILDVLPFFRDRSELRALDLGCGVGRNCICIAQYCGANGISCTIDCVDILDFAIEKLHQNAEVYGVSQSIRGLVQPIDTFLISPNHYDWIIAVSALEHMDSKASFSRKLEEIRNGIREGGIVCIIMNSNVRECDKITKMPTSAQFEVNLPTEELCCLLSKTFSCWQILKSTVQEQHYDIPRESGIRMLHTDVVTFVAKK